MCSSLALGITVAAAALVPAVAGAPAAADGSSARGGQVCAAAAPLGVAVGGAPCAGGPSVHRPTCALDDSADFPIDTRIHRGPDAYRTGDGYQEWTVDLTNTTDETCGRVHPILVLVDRARTLKPEQIQLEFDDGTRRRPVPFERTGQGENIGVFDGAGFGGFRVAPGRTVSVGVRLTFTSDTGANHVVASAALVQRRDDDGDWVGDSNDYPFDVVTEGPATPTAEQLAQTGPGTPLATGIAAGAVLLGAGAAVVGARRLRARRR
ncbi:hypothetical protein [Streptomyces sp. NPDC058308]|uniref:hypothetical protein n=1 Tax=Streptomyces sp. NPDC058308 TaxID=3346440 RepID=UPI0036DFBCFD